MKAFICKVCGFISIDGSAPEKCPVCGSPKTAFNAQDNAIKTPKDQNNLTELEKKHIPVISIEKKCDFMENDCQTLKIKIGEIMHPMQKDHSIGNIDCYINKQFIARIQLTPESLNPSAALHLKNVKGEMSVVETCNIHGSWIKHINL